MKTGMLKCPLFTWKKTNMLWRSKLLGTVTENIYYTQIYNKRPLFADSGVYIEFPLPFVIMFLKLNSQQVSVRFTRHTKSNVVWERVREGDSI